ncbi:MAG: hypothetical protein FJ267_16600 [Planctomycetes bacterium]|nr:hypothetical protein [Planctomycetota bacterium]
MSSSLMAPSSKDRQSNPDLPADASLEVVLHQVPLKDTTLYLVTTMKTSSAQAGAFYGRQYDI